MDSKTRTETRTDRYPLRILADGMVRYWSVYDQRWARQAACMVPARELAAMPARDRERVLAVAAEWTRG